jgi:hypothetical protein
MFGIFSKKLEMSIMSLYHLTANYVKQSMGH